MSSATPPHFFWYRAGTLPGQQSPVAPVVINVPVVLNLHRGEDSSSTVVTANIPVVLDFHGCTVSDASVHTDLDVVYRSKSASKTCSEAETKSVQCNEHAPEKGSLGVKVESPADDPFVTPLKVKPARRREPISTNQCLEDIVCSPSEFISATAPVRSLTPPLGRQRRLSEPLTTSPRVRCAGITKKGTPCKNSPRRSFSSLIPDADVDKKLYCHWHVSQASSPGFKSPADDPFVTPLKVEPARRREPISTNQCLEDIVCRPLEFISATAPVRSLTPPLGRQRRLSEPLTTSPRVRCVGITKKGTPCKNSSRRLFSSLIPDADVDKKLYCHWHVSQASSPGFKSPADDPFVTPLKVKPARRREPISTNQCLEDIVHRPSEFISATAPVRSLTPPLGRQRRLPEPLTTSPRVRCAGITKKGTPCKNSPRRSFSSLVPDADVDKKLYCHWHVSQLEASPGFTVQRNGTTKRVNYDDYIPPYLQPATRFELIQLMKKAISENDEIGWLYCAEISEQTDAEAIFDDSQEPLILKVGRSQEPEARMAQWFSQCGKPLIPRGCFPSKDRDNTSLNDYIPRSTKGVWSHRLEHLVHLELADLAVNAPYLEPEWERFVKGRGKGKKYQWQTFKILEAYRATKRGNYNAGQACEGCGIKHREIFSFPRIPSGPYKGKEWVIVKDVAEGWARFVRKYVS